MINSCPIMVLYAKAAIIPFKNIKFMSSNFQTRYTNQKRVRIAVCRIA